MSPVQWNLWHKEELWKTKQKKQGWNSFLWINTCTGCNKEGTDNVTHLYQWRGGPLKLLPQNKKVQYEGDLRMDAESGRWTSSLTVRCTSEGEIMNVAEYNERDTWSRLFYLSVKLPRDTNQKYYWIPGKTVTEDRPHPSFATLWSVKDVKKLLTKLLQAHWYKTQADNRIYHSQRWISESQGDNLCGVSRVGRQQRHTVRSS